MICWEVIDDVMEELVAATDVDASAAECKVFPPYCHDLMRQFHKGLIKLLPIRLHSVKPWFIIRQTSVLHGEPTFWDWFLPGMLAFPHAGGS